jgi:membrane-bound inhibitor of C-type lysozyme
MKRVQWGAMSLPLLLLLPALPVAAQQTTQQSTQQRIYSYQCEGGRSFQVEYSPDLARVSMGSGRPVPLAQVISASGARYSNGQLTLFTKGSNAFLQEGDRITYNNCVGQTVATGQTNSARTVTYQCQSDRAFSARFSSQEADLLLDNRGLTLPRVESTSGARFSNGRTTLYAKGNQAFIEENGQRTYENCIAQTSTTTTTTTQTTTRESTTRQAPANQTPDPSIRGMW